MLDFAGTHACALRQRVFPDIVKSVFRQNGNAGAFMILGRRSPPLRRATQVNTKGGVSTVTALPIFRSEDAHRRGGSVPARRAEKCDEDDDAAPAGDERHRGRRDRLFDSEGRQVREPHAGHTRYAYVALPDDVPARTTPVRVRNNTAGAKSTATRGSSTAERATSSRSCSCRGEPGLSTSRRSPAMSPGREISISVANASPEPITVSATKSYVKATRRRYVRSSEPLGLPPPAAGVTVTIPGYGSRSLTVSSTATGFVRVTGPDALRATATMSMPRNAAAPGADPGTRGIGRRPRPGVGGDDQPRHRDLSRSRGLHRRHGRGRAAAHVPREIQPSSKPAGATRGSGSRCVTPSRAAMPRTTPRIRRTIWSSRTGALLSSRSPKSSSAPAAKRSATCTTPRSTSKS